jgi:hypothetical protein
MVQYQKFLQLFPLSKLSTNQQPVTMSIGRPISLSLKTLLAPKRMHNNLFVNKFGCWKKRSKAQPEECINLSE